GHRALDQPKQPECGSLLAELPKTALSKGLRLHILKASTETDIDAAFGVMAQAHAGALLAGSDVFFNSRRDQIIALAARRAIPAIYDTPAFTDAGGLPMAPALRKLIASSASTPARCCTAPSRPICQCS